MFHSKIMFYELSNKDTGQYSNAGAVGRGAIRPAHIY